MNRLIPVAIGFAAGILAGFPMAYVFGRPLNPAQLGILLVLSVVILLRFLVRRAGVVNQSR